MKLKIISILSVILLLTICLCSCAPIKQIQHQEANPFSYITINGLNVSVPINLSEFLTCTDSTWEQIDEQMLTANGTVEGFYRLKTGENNFEMMPIKIHQVSEDPDDVHIEEITFHESLQVVLKDGITIGSTVTEILNAYQGYHTYLAEELSEINKDDAIVKCKIPEYNYTVLFKIKDRKVCEITLVMNYTEKLELATTK